MINIYVVYDESDAQNIKAFVTEKDAIRFSRTNGNFYVDTVSLHGDGELTVQKP